MKGLQTDLIEEFEALKGLQTYLSESVESLKGLQLYLFGGLKAREKERVFCVLTDCAMHGLHWNAWGEKLSGRQDA